MQATINRDELQNQPRRRLYIRFHIEIGMRADATRHLEPTPEQVDPQERNFRREQIARRIDRERTNTLELWQLKY